MNRPEADPALLPAFDGARGLKAGLLRLGGSGIDLKILTDRALARALSAQGHVYSSARVPMRATRGAPTQGVLMRGYVLEDDGIWRVGTWRLVGDELRDEGRCRELYCGVALALIVRRPGPVVDATVPV